MPSHSIASAQGETSRAVVPLRALAMYEDPDTKDTIVSFFGHENPVPRRGLESLHGYAPTPQCPTPRSRNAVTYSST